MRNKLNKILAVALAIHLIFGGISPVFAQEVSVTPTDEGTVVADPENSPDEENQPDENISHGSGRNEPENPGEPLGSGRNEQETAEQTISEEQNQTQDSFVNSEGNTNNDGNNGDAYISTGDGTTTGTLITDANTNLSLGAGCCGGGGTAIVNDGNGRNSDNNGSAKIVNDNATNQNNSANIDNGLTGATITGNNSASNNTNGDSSVTTGNANATGTIITSANTNVDGLAISEFNIVDDHNGDFVLDFGANCISGCDGFTNLAQNSNNGAGSNNDANLDITNNNTTNQLNYGEVNNDLNLTADSGNNSSSGNTGGDSSITTGKASVAGNVLTMLNNNLAGNVIFGVVNIFGELIGDIILPESALNAFACATCGGDTSLVNSGNGANSDNNASSTQNNNTTYNQINNADINNNLILDSTTGGNSASGNTGGDAYIRTGNSNVLAQVLNVANTNLIGGDMWLVIINRAGQWIGQIVGAPQGSLFAGSEGSEFSVNENGEITVVNNGNGAGSTNNGSVDSTNNNTINQTNDAVVNNNLHLSANTGKNSASNNTGGDSYITTGHAEVIANLVNFVNNNIVGGKLLVTFVNVFGDWTGNFITPGQQKITTEANVQGGTEENNSNPTLTQSNTPPAQGSTGGTNSSGSSSNSNSGSNVIAAAGFFSQPSNNGGSGGNNGGSNNQVTVAGINTQGIINSLTKGDAKEKVRINLAWAILLTPMLAGAIILKKIYNRIRARHTA